MPQWSLRWNTYGAVAQLGERDNRTVEARGSIPRCSTILSSRAIRIEPRQREVRRPSRLNLAGEEVPAHDGATAPPLLHRICRSSLFLCGRLGSDSHFLKREK